MKHCPACKIDFADEFESCFQCGCDLAEGGIEGPVLERVEEEKKAQAAAESQAARRMVSLAKRLAVGFAVAVALVVVLVIVTDDTVEVKKTWTLVHDDTDAKVLLDGPGVVRNEKERRDLQERTGFVLPPVEAGKTMLAYYPVASKVVFRKRMPVIGGAHRDEYGLVVHVRPSDEETPAAARLFEGMGRRMVGRWGQGEVKLPSYQLVPVARLDLTAERVRYAVPRSLGGSEEEATLQELSQSFVREITLGVFGSFFKLAIGGMVGFLFFFWILVKLS